MVAYFKKLWDSSTGFRHAIVTYLSSQVMLPLTEIALWANSHGASPFPNVKVLAMNLGFGVVSAGVAYLIKTIQQRRAFPPVQ